MMCSASRTSSTSSRPTRSLVALLSNQTRTASRTRWHELSDARSEATSKAGPRQKDVQRRWHAREDVHGHDQVNGISRVSTHGRRRPREDGSSPQSDKGTNTWYTGGSAIYFSTTTSLIRVYDTKKELQHYTELVPETGNVQYETMDVRDLLRPRSPSWAGPSCTTRRTSTATRSTTGGARRFIVTCPLNQARMVPEGQTSSCGDVSGQADDLAPSMWHARRAAPVISTSSTSSSRHAHK